MTLTYEKPLTLPEALALLTASPGRYPVLAGGTDLIVQWQSGAIAPEGFVDISGIAEMRKIQESEYELQIGAMATHAQIAVHPLVRRHFPALAMACATIGAVQIQNRGTIGGNIMNASPAGDTLPALAVHGAEVLAQDLTGERWIPSSGLFTGYRRTVLKAQELLTAVRMIKPEPGEISRFFKVGTRQAQAISKVSLAVRCRSIHGGIGSIAIALGCVAPTVVRAPATEALLTGSVITDGLIHKARECLMDELKPIDDIRSSADYRRFAAAGLLARFLRELTVPSASAFSGGPRR